PRALWKGAISFGLVNVPVELYPAAKSNTLDLTWLDRRSMDPVGYKRVNKRTGKEVPKEEIVKGYEYEKGEYVVLGAEDFKRANPVATQTVEIHAFVDRESIPPMFFETPYYLAPGKRGEKAYALLRETMKRANRIAVATVVIMTKQHLAVLIPWGNLLLLNTVRHADEIRDSSELTVPSESAKSAGVSQKEVDMAIKLVESMEDAWKPEQYHDTYREDLLKRVKEKVAAGETEVVPEPTKEKAPAHTAEVVDLVALLQNSLRDKGTGAKGRKSAERGTMHRAAASAKAGSSARASTKGTHTAKTATKNATRERKRA
ncbi:MAG: Ku protein, partial [Myxococcales bacterium]|nr:Ku protein [Myxococcales bacterium]